MFRTRTDHIRPEISLSASRFSRLPNRIFILLITFYQRAISPFLPPSCRFEPSCSAYGLAAFRKYPLPKALFLTIKRVIRCNPFCRGGYDPLP